MFSLVKVTEKDAWSSENGAQGGWKHKAWGLWSISWLQRKSSRRFSRSREGPLTYFLSLKDGRDQLWFPLHWLVCGRWTPVTILKIHFKKQQKPGFMPLSLNEHSIPIFYPLFQHQPREVSWCHHVFHPRAREDLWSTLSGDYWAGE